MITDHILEKKASLIAFRQTLTKVLSVAYIFSNTTMTNLKKLTGNKSLNTKQYPARLSPRTIHLNLYGKPWGWGRLFFKKQFFKTVKLLVFPKNFLRLKTICSLIFPKCLVVLRKECAWEQGKEGKFDKFYHPLHFMFDLYKDLIYRRPPF